MARRKRLSPTAALAASPDMPRETYALRPPIASVVAEAASHAAFGEVWPPEITGRGPVLGTIYLLEQTL